MSGVIRFERDSLSVGEADGVVRIAVLRTGDLSGAAAVTLGLTANEAQPGADYGALPDFVDLAFAPGQARAVFEVPVLDDADGEPTESFDVALVSVEGATLSAPRTVRVDILDDETPVEDPAVPPLESPFEVERETVVDGLTRPIAFEFSPVEPELLYVAEKRGTIQLYESETGADLGTLLDISARVNDRGDRGLMDIALHPDFETNPYLYVFYVVDPVETAGQSGSAGRDGDGDRFSWVERFTLDADSGYRAIEPGSGVVILGAGGQSLDDISGGGAVNSTRPDTVDLQASDIAAIGADGEPVYKTDYVKVDSLSHAGGALAFGPDGALYVTTGDGTSFNFADPRTVGVQDVDSLAGKVLRIDPLTGEGLADNPFVEPGMGLGENAAKVYQLGLRNPFSMGFDADGALYVTDTGWRDWEEINSGGPGANFGWPFYEGGDGGVSLETRDYRDLPEAELFYAAIETGDVAVDAAFRGFSHRNQDPGFQVQAITGGDVVYDGDRYPAALQGAYFFADVSQGEVFAVDAEDRRNVNFLFETASGLAPVHFSQGPDGYVYYADIAFGEIGRLLIEDAAALPSIVVETDGFATGAEGWSAGASIAGTGVLDGFLGRLGGETTEKTFAAPAGADSVTVTFDFIEIDSWDGDQGDAFFVEINGQRVFTQELFHAGRVTADGVDDGSDPGASGVAATMLGGVAWSVAPLTDGADDLGFAFWSDQIHRVTLEIDAPGEAFTLGVGSTLTQGLIDESFGIDNVEVVARGADLRPVAGTLEFGTVTLMQPSGSDWTAVAFETAIDDAVVVMGPLTDNGPNPAMARVRNVTDEGFEFQIDEWSYLDGWHMTETVSWMAMSAGSYTLEDGRTVSAGRVEARDERFSEVDLEGFDDAPIVFTQTSAFNGPAPVITRVADVSADGFRVKMQEEEAADGRHAPEWVSWIAIEAGGDGDGATAGRTADAVTHRPFDLDLDAARDDGFVFIADIQSFDGGDAAELRYEETATGVTFHIEEERSRDAETAHTTEIVGWLTAEAGSQDLFFA